MEQEGYRMTNKNLQTIQKRVHEIYNYYKSELELLPEDKKSLSYMTCYIDTLEKVMGIIQEEIESNNRKER
jgi:hypothetical protein